jgi:hypothetical protein
LASFASFPHAWWAIICACVKDILLWYVDCAAILVAVEDEKMVFVGTFAGAAGEALLCK